jgi:hypothetical protein
MSDRDPEDFTTARAAVVKQVRKNLKTFPDTELEKWRDETNSRTLKKVIDAEIERRYWNSSSDIEPLDMK